MRSIRIVISLMLHSAPGGGGGGYKLYGGVPLKWVTFSQKIKSLNMGNGFAEKSLNMGCSFVILL